ncbi:MAG: glycosyltransferase family 4 protein [Terracidiphilus sp.]|nr:glycosyltransferase family 4 protein [Terracidiphilus sp.]
MSKKRLAILTNMLTPYRLSAYRKLGDAFDVLILHGGTEANRSWNLNVPESLKTKKVWTYQLTRKKETGVAGVSDTNYVHLNLGLLWSLPLFRPDVIVTHEMGVRTVVAVLYGKLMRVPVWVWWGGTLHSERNISQGRRRLRRWMVRNVRRWISYGTTSTEYLESIGAKREEILQIQNCVPQETFTAEPRDSKKWFAELPRPVLLSVGQLIPRKGVDRFVEACGRAAQRGEKFSVVLVGNGPEKDNLYKRAEQLGLKSFQILLNQSQETLNAMYRAADVFIFPTLEDVWGLVVNEAMWAGMPVLCSQFAGCAPELVPESCIFDPTSPESFDAALGRALAGELAPPERERLLTWQQVGELLVRSLESGVPVR